MISSVKAFVYHSLRRLGYTIIKNEYLQVESQAITRIAPWLRERGIKTILDVGAHKGETALAYHQALPGIQIYSFEPQPEVFAELQVNVQNISNIKALNFALGDTTGEQVFYRNAYSPSSSLLPLDNLHKEKYPFAADTLEDRVQVKQLDHVASELNFGAPILLKMDAQGYEKHIIDGARNTLERVDVVITEINFQPLFEGQTEFSELYDRLYPLGFSFRGPFGDISVDQTNGLALFSSGVFVRER